MRTLKLREKTEENGKKRKRTGKNGPVTGKNGREQEKLAILREKLAILREKSYISHSWLRRDSNRAEACQKGGPFRFVHDFLFFSSKMSNE